MSKPKVGFYWCASCGGCEEAVIDLGEAILDVVEAVDIVFWPVALDFKVDDVKAMADGEMAAVFINGAIRSSEQEEMVRLLRRKAGLAVAFGSCAHTGGIPGLANLFDRAEMLQEVYIKSPSVTNDGKALPQLQTQVPEGTLSLPKLWDTVKTLDQVIEVDYYLPGCPPTANLIADAVSAILKGQLPQKGAVLAPDVALCEECRLRDSKPEKLAIKEFKRPHEVLIDPNLCLLAQGLLCLGPATRKGCGAMCPGGAMPCTGCFGPTSRVMDFGAKILSGVSSLVEAKEEEEIAAIMAKVADPVGTFYRYSLPASLLHRRHQSAIQGGDQ